MIAERHMPPGLRVPPTARIGKARRKPVAEGKYVGGSWLKEAAASPARPQLYSSCVVWALRKHWCMLQYRHLGRVLHDPINEVDALYISQYGPNDGMWYEDGLELIMDVGKWVPPGTILDSCPATAWHISTMLAQTPLLEARHMDRGYDPDMVNAYGCPDHSKQPVPGEADLHAMNIVCLAPPPPGKRYWEAVSDNRHWGLRYGLDGLLRVTCGGDDTEWEEDIAARLYWLVLPDGWQEWTIRKYGS